MQDLLQTVGALLLVLAAMGGLALLIRQSGLAGAAAVKSNKKRLKVLESIQLDPKHRAILLACDNTAHLIVLNSTSETVVKTDLPVPSDDDDAVKPI